MNNTIEINGVTYMVLNAENFMHNGSPRVSLTLRRPNGRRTYVAVVYENGAISECV